MSETVFSKGVSLFASCFEDDDEPQGTPPEVLLIGACNSGKTLIARQLKSHPSNNTATSSALQSTRSLTQYSQPAAFVVLQSCAHPRMIKHLSTLAPHQLSATQENIHTTHPTHSTHQQTRITHFSPTSLLPSLPPSAPCPVCLSTHSTTTTRRHQTGVEVDTLTLPHNRRFLLKEVGGNLATTWPHYYKTTPAPALILYTVNSANPAALSASLVHLLALLSWLYRGECATRLLLLYTGLDSVFAASQSVLESVCRWTDIVDEYRKQRGVEVVQVRCSGLTGERCDVVMREVLLMLGYERTKTESVGEEKRWRAQRRVE